MHLPLAVFSPHAGLPSLGTLAPFGTLALGIPFSPPHGSSRRQTGAPAAPPPPPYLGQQHHELTPSDDLLLVWVSVGLLDLGQTGRFRRGERRRKVMLMCGVHLS